MVFWLLFSNESIQNILILSATVAPFASAGIRPVVKRLNQDTTVYYGLVFCLFSWPYMVKLVYLKGRNAAVGKEQWRNEKLSVKYNKQKVIWG